MWHRRVWAGRPGSVPRPEVGAGSPSPWPGARRAEGRESAAGHRRNPPRNPARNPNHREHRSRPRREHQHRCSEPNSVPRNRRWKTQSDPRTHHSETPGAHQPRAPKTPFAHPTRHPATQRDHQDRYPGTPPAHRPPRSAAPYASRCRRPTTPNWTRGPHSRPTPQARTAPVQPANPRIPHSARGTGRPGRTRAARTHRPGTLTRPRVPVPRRPLAWAPEGRRRSDAPPFVTVLGIPGALHASHALEVPAVPALFDPPDRFPVPRAPGVPDAPETGVPPDAGPHAEPETGPETAPEPALAPCPETEPGAGPEASLAPAPEKNPGAEPEAGTVPVPALKSAPETEPEVPSVTAPGFSEARAFQEAPVGPEPSAYPAKPDPGRSKPPSPVAIAPSDPGHPAASVTSAESISPAEFTEATGSRDPTESREFTGPAEAVGFSGSPGPRHPTPPAIQVHVALPCSCTPRSLIPGPPFVRMRAAVLVSLLVYGRVSSPLSPARPRNRPRQRIPAAADRHPGRGRTTGGVPPCVRVTLRVAPARTGTSPRPRGICPERPPTLR